MAVIAVLGIKASHFLLRFPNCWQEKDCLVDEKGNEYFFIRREQDCLGRRFTDMQIYSPIDRELADCVRRHFVADTVNERKRKKLTADERQQIYDKYNGHCAYCGCKITLKEMQADHLEPFNLGGTDELSNLMPSCRSCNHYKSTLPLERFRAMLERMPTVLMRDSVTYKNAVRFGLVIPNNQKVQFYFEKCNNK